MAASGFGLAGVAGGADDVTVGGLSGGDCVEGFDGEGPVGVVGDGNVMVVGSEVVGDPFRGEVEGVAASDGVELSDDGRALERLWGL